MKKGYFLKTDRVKTLCVPPPPPLPLTHQCFCLSEEDLSSKVQLVSSVHALSYFLKTTTVVDKTVQDFAHRAEGEGWREGV